MRDQIEMLAGMRNRESILCGVRIIEAQVPKIQEYPKNHAEARFSLSKNNYLWEIQERH